MLSDKQLKQSSMKKPYQRPQLLAYGTIRDLTQGTGTNRLDNPASPPPLTFSGVTP